MRVVSKQIDELFDNDREYDDNGDKIDRSKVKELTADEIITELITLTGVNNKTIESAQELKLNKSEIRGLWYIPCKGRNTRTLSEILTKVMVGDIGKSDVLEMIRED